MQPHQVVGVVDGDFSDGGTAGVRQVGVTVVDRESAETWKIAQRILYLFSCYICWTDLGSFFSLYLHMCFFVSWSIICLVSSYWTNGNL